MGLAATAADAIEQLVGGVRDGGTIVRPHALLGRVDTDAGAMCWKARLVTDEAHARSVAGQALLASEMHARARARCIDGLGLVAARSFVVNHAGECWALTRSPWLSAAAPVDGARHVEWFGHLVAGLHDAWAGLRVPPGVGPPAVVEIHRRVAQDPLLGGLASALLVDGPTRRSQLAHRDLSPRNLLEVDGSPVLIDWEDCGAMDPVAELGRCALDVAGLATGRPDLERAERFLAAYRTRRSTMPTSAEALSWWSLMWIRHLAFLARLRPRLASMAEAADRARRDGVDRLRELADQRAALLADLGEVFRG